MKGAGRKAETGMTMAVGTRSIIYPSLGMQKKNHLSRWHLRMSARGLWLPAGEYKAGPRVRAQVLTLGVWQTADPARGELGTQTVG